MSDIVSACVDNLRVSRAIFKLRPGNGNDLRFIQSDLVDKIEQAETDDVVQELVNTNFREQFAKERGVFVVNSDVKGSVMGQIRATIEVFYREHSPLKRPETSGTYKWLIGSGCNTHDSETLDGFVMLYRYIKTSLPSQTTVLNPNYDAHISNVLTIIGKMRDRYEK